MRTYETKLELIDEIRKTSNLFINEFKNIKEDEKDIYIEGVDKTPSQMIAYQLGWVNLVLKWDSDEKKGGKVVTPTEKYKWNNLGELYKDFYIKYKDYSLQELIVSFEETIEILLEWINTLNDDELYQQDKRKWASSTPSKWPIWKWIHINSVAPFKNFRTLIRKWKQLKLS